MPCPCCEPPGINEIETVFDSGRAKTEADAYLRAGLDARGTRLIAYLLQNSDGPLRLLDIGSGAGGVHYELLRRGLAASAVAVDASSAYIAAARTVGERLGLDSRVHYVHGDFTAAADTISPADAVILDRVICCYPNLNDLLGAVGRQSRTLPRPQLSQGKMVGAPRLQPLQSLPPPQAHQLPHLPAPPQRRPFHRHQKRPRAGPRRHPRPLANHRLQTHLIPLTPLSSLLAVPLSLLTPLHSLLKDVFALVPQCPRQPVRSTLAAAAASPRRPRRRPPAAR